MNELKPSPVLLCANCTAELQGAFCHDCGQSVKSVIQPVSHMLEDAGDLFFHLDERIVHTLPPLYTKPGFLTLEYFSGRRVRYIAPFRLMFVFCLLAFFFMHLAIGDMKVGGVEGTAPRDSIDAFASAKTAGEVHTLYEDQVREVRTARNDPNLPGAAKAGLGAAAALIREAANARLVQLKAPPITAEEGEIAPADVASRGEAKVTKMFGNNPQIDVSWFPDALNRRLNVAFGHFRANFIPILNKGPGKEEAIHRILDGFFSVLPQTMFFMIPVFALVLKLFYVFRRRLYMEHLIVSLHSHAFIFISLLFLMLLSFAREAIGPRLALAGTAIGFVQFAMWVWIPIYLLMMQKRVYRQGWPMTILKYWLIGSVYFWLLLSAVIMAAVIGMTH
ncbi:DUF3667 domain-containing protein [Luteibacter sp. OK325]|uniref:DUF3667 domain-containing protein n=1 Tax=Luteibacter sp. OK325 TaxID=2135670 RepID=UPI001304C2EA|nr:DUF3667 domain-containing protein [Luteibacter sp. OK325]